MRSADKSFATLLLIEGLDEQAIRNALWRVRSLAPGIDPDLDRISLYTAFFNLRR